jgi:hypothetical protein
MKLNQQMARSTAGLLLGASLFATPPPPSAQGADVPVSREEFETMQKEMAALRKEIATLKKAKTDQGSQINSADSSGGSTPVSRAKGSANSARLDTPALNALSREIKAVKEMAEENRAGETKFVLTGGASSSFTAPSHGTSKFDATFSPILLWHINDRLLFEGEVEYELDDTNNSTKTNLEYAHLSYLLNDNLTIGVGKFLSSMNIFVERYEPKWINKLPDTPLAIYDGILPETNVGAQLRGVVPVGSTKFNFAAYVCNAPSIASDVNGVGTGTLIFDNFKSSGSNGKAIGGRVGFMPCEYLEVGYGLQQSKVRIDGLASDAHYDALLQSVDLSTSIEKVNGRFTLQSQYAWSEVGRGTDFGLNASRSGGYAQLSYRGKKWASDFFNRLEGIVRLDRVSQPDPAATDSFNEKRVTFGLDYWLTSRTVMKTAYELDRQTNGHQGSNSVLLGVATGF